MSASANAYPERRWRLGLLFSGVWLVALIEPTSKLFDAGVPAWQTALGLVVVVAFVLVYFAGVRTPFEPPRRALVYPAMMLVLALVLILLAGESALNALIFVAVSMQAAWPTRAAVLGCLGLIAFTLVVCAATPGWVASDYVFSIGTASLAMFGVVRIAERNKQLRRAQDRLSELAVMEERERFARDLHDVLGHSLTVMTLKAELARKLVTRDPERAETEVADIERLAREALADLRATVGGYREVSLVSELSAARVALEAAGIEADLPNAVDEVPGEHRELFGWVVREGVTNVVRHSRAAQCSVRVAADTVEVVDDGPGTAAAGTTAEPESGHGLLGLRERVASVGGRLEAGPGPSGGFVLRVSLPQVSDRPDARQPALA